MIATHLRVANGTGQPRAWLICELINGISEQVEAALRNDWVKQIAKQSGVPVDAAIDLLAQQLPTTIDKASPVETLQG